MPGDQSPSAPEQVSVSFLDDDDAQAEDNEGEVEEEEKGGDDAEEEEEEEEGENESDLPDKADDGDREDAREDVTCQRRDGSFGSTRVDVDLDVAFAGKNRSAEFGGVDKKDAGTLSEQNPSTHFRNPNSDSNADLADSQILNAQTLNASSTDEKVMVAAMQMNNFFGRKDMPHSHGEIKHTDTQSSDDRKRTASRLASSGIETRSLTPSTEIKDQNKRSAIVCDFYAKGWCIKGSSCRFLHVKDHQNNELPQREGDVAADSKTEVQLEGPLAASVGSKSVFSSQLSSQRVQPWEHIERKTMHHFPEVPKFLSFQRDELFPFSFKDLGSKRTRQNGSAHDHGDHGSLGRLCHEYTVSSSHQFMNPSHSRSVGELASIQSQRPYNCLPSPLSSHPPNSSSRNSILATGTLSSNRVSVWTGSSLPFSYSSLNASHLGSSSSSLLQSSSHFSVSGTDNLTSTKRKISSNDWEPSIPFQPSFLLRSLIATPGSLYDPLHDSVELPKLGDISLKASLHSQGSSVLNTSNQQNIGDVVSEPRGLACNDETMSVSSHNTNHGKDTQTTDVEVVGTSTDRKRRKVLKEENSLGSSAVKDITGTTSDGRGKRFGPRDSVDVKIDSLRQKNKMDAGNIVEGGVDKESKALRHFRAALIDSVKESLKPKWREGHLSKDAHNKIVKKAVEKVLTTMQPDQMPTSMELVVQYLASSRPKIDKLVEGYAEIYGKL